MSATTWRELIQAVQAGPLVACTLSEAELDEEFEGGLGSVLGKAFTAWTETWVLFPVVYDGAQWVGCVPRNPCDQVTRPQGGGGG